MVECLAVVDEAIWQQTEDPDSSTRGTNLDIGVVEVIYVILCPGERQVIKELLKLMGRNRDRLHNSMTAEQRETLEKYDDCVNEMHSVMEFEIFSYAFRLGGRFMLAVLMDGSDEA